MQDIKINLSDETYVFFAELALLNDLPPEHFLVEAIETYRAYLTHNIREDPVDGEALPEQVYPKKVH